MLLGATLLTLWIAIWAATTAALTLTYKKCTCCEQSLSFIDWKLREKIGPPVCVEGEYDLEMRNCGCGSTLAVERRCSHFPEGSAQ